MFGYPVSSAVSALRSHRFVEWARDGRQRGLHFLMLSVPLRPIRCQR